MMVKSVMMLASSKVSPAMARLVHAGLGLYHYGTRALKGFQGMNGGTSRTTPRPSNTETSEHRAVEHRAEDSFEASLLEGDEVNAEVFSVQNHERQAHALR